MRQSDPKPPEWPRIDAAINIDWHHSPACGICRDITGMTLAVVPIGALLRHYLPGIPAEGLARAHPLVVTAGDFARPLLSAEEIGRINVFKSRKRQIEWLAGRLAAKSLARLHADGMLTLTDAGIAYRPEGAPYLKHCPDLSLSISHAGDYAVAGMDHSSEAAIGLDIEKTRDLDIASILPIAFSDRERQHLDPGDQDRFFACWTLKEAYLKYLGRGFRESLKKVEILGMGTIRHYGQVVHGLRIQRLRPFPAYALAIVAGPRPEVM